MFKVNKRALRKLICDYEKLAGGPSSSISDVDVVDQSKRSRQEPQGSSSVVFYKATTGLAWSNARINLLKLTNFKIVEKKQMDLFLWILLWS